VIFLSILQKCLFAIIGMYEYFIDISHIYGVVVYV